MESTAPLIMGNSNPMNPSDPRNPGFAAAKINLGLEVLSERLDGYHEISTLFLRVSEPHDRLTVTRAGFFRATSSDPSLPMDDANLVLRAARGFEQLTGAPLPTLLVHLEKRIPMGAGLGGGSSDAAAMLQLLREHTRAQHPLLAEGELLNLAAKIGADVPFFLTGAHAAAARGIGEILTPIEVKMPGSILIVVDPAVHVSTREAYAMLSPTPKAPSVDYAKFFETPRKLKAWREVLHNDFEPGIFRRYPKLAEIKHALYSRGAGFALMSGSGSAVYGIFEDLEMAQKAKQSFQDESLLAFLN